MVDGGLDVSGWGRIEDLDIYRFLTKHLGRKTEVGFQRTAIRE